MLTDNSLLVPFVNEAPYFEQYLGLWAIREHEFLGHIEWAKGLDLRAHLASPQAAFARDSGSGPQITVQDGVAIVPIRGTLMKQVSSMSSGTSTVLARRQLRQLANDSDVKAILLHIDSPGGTVAGTKELADDIAAAAQKKPVHAYIDDLGASAAYWVASQATKVFANETALVGSIGTYGVVQDLSGLAAREGVKVHVVRAGAFKGSGTPGTEVTAEQLADLQRIVNEQNDFFLKGVAKGRDLSLSQVRDLADGRVHVGKAAQALGLIDGVSTLDAAFAQLAKTKSTKGNKAMSEQADAPKAATLKELRAACPGADEKFLVAQLENDATVASAQIAWMTSMSAANAAVKAEAESLKAENAQLKADLAEAKKAPPAPAASGVDPLPVGNPPAPPSANAKADFDEAVAEHVKAGATKAAATSKVVKEQPALYKAMLAEANKRS